MEKLDLTDLVASNSSFKLGQFKGKTFNLTPCTGGKLIEMNKIFGNIEKMLSIPSAENIAKIAMYLMDFEGQSCFKSQQVKFIDVESGEEVTEKVGGWKILARSFSGVNEQWDVYRAILESLGHPPTEAKKTIQSFKASLNKMIEKEIGPEEVKKKKSKKRI